MIKKSEYDEHKPTQVLQITTRKLLKKMGQEPLTNLIRLQAALNKIYSLWDLMHLTDRASKNQNKARSERNRATAIIFTIGTLNELFTVLNALKRCCTNVEEHRDSHKIISGILSAYDKNRNFKELMRKYRNDISFHLHRDLVQVLNEDLVKITGNTVKEFAKFEHQILRDTYYHTADEAIHRAFFKKEFNQLLVNRKHWVRKFRIIYPKTMKQFIDYVFDIHKCVTENGVSLIRSTLEEFGIKRSDFKITNLN